MPSKMPDVVSTTTLSTIVLQRTCTKIVVALLKSGNRLHLQLLLMEPDIGYLGDDFEEAAKLQRSLVEVLQQLQSKQNPVEDLLRQADELIVNQRPKACVYSAMAESLGTAWKDLHALIEQRRSIVDKNFLFQGHLQDFMGKVGVLQETLSKAANPWKTVNLAEIRGQKRSMLEASVFALQEGDGLLNLLQETWSQTVPGITPQDVRCSLGRAIEKVELMMETIYDRRTAVTEMLQIYLKHESRKWPKLDQVLILGSSLAEVEEAIQWYQRLSVQVKELANSSLASYESAIKERLEQLSKAHAFFSLAEAIEKKLSDVNLSEDEINDSIECLTSLASAVFVYKDVCDVEGVQSRWNVIKGKLESLKNSLNQQKRSSVASVKTFTNRLDEMSQWLNQLNVAPGKVLMGNTSQQVSAFMAQCKDTLYTLQRKSHEIEGMFGALKIIADEELEPSQDQRHEEIMNRLRQCAKIQEDRIDLATAYLKFLKVTNDLESEMKSCGSHNSLTASLERQRQSIQQLYLQACNLSKNCISLLHEKVHARVEAKSTIENIKHIMDRINTRQNELIAAWSALKCQQESRAAANKQKEEQLLEDLRSAWRSLDPFIHRLDQEPSAIVTSLEQSYGQLSKVRQILNDLGKTSTAQDRVVQGQKTIKGLEDVFQSLITFTKHLASIKQAVKIEMAKYAETTPSQSLLSSESQAKEHEQSKKVMSDKLSNLINEALGVEQKIAAFEAESRSPMIKVIGGDLALNKLAEGLRNDFNQAWDSKKKVLTTRAKELWLQQEIDKCLARVDDIASTVLNSRNDLKSVGKQYQAVQKQYDDQLHQLRTDSVLGSQITLLRSKLDQLQDRIQAADLYFDHVLQLEKILTELESRKGHADEEYLKKQMAEFDALRSQISNLTQKIGNFIRRSHNIEEIVTRYEHTLNLIRQSQPPPRPPPPATVSPHFEVDLKDLVLLEGDRCLMKAKVSGDPSPKMTWFKDGVPVDKNPDYRSEYDEDSGWCSMTISETMVADSANWSVRASNMGGYAESHAKLTVKESRAIPAIPPSVVRPLKQITAKSGETVTLSCSFDGFPIPHLTWYKNDVKIHSQGASNEGVLVIKEASPEDEGMYCCRGQNDHGTAQSASSLNIKIATQMPVFVEPLANMEVVIGQPLMLKCRIHPGHPPPEIIWQHNGQTLYEHSHYDTSTQILTLFIEKTTNSSGGKYTCIIRNPAGMATSTAVVSLKEPMLVQAKMTPPAFYVPLKNQECMEGENVVLEAVIISTPPPHEVLWFLNDKLVVNGKPQSQGDVFQLVLQSTSKGNHEGNYKIVATNLAGTAQSACALTIHQNGGRSAACIVQKLVGVSADLGDQVKLSAVVQGQPKPKVSWKRNGQVLTPPLEGMILSSEPDGHYSLVLLNVEESATYSIQATNELGGESSSAEVEVRPPRPPWPQQQRLARPSKFRKGEMYHSDYYDSDWDASPIPPKWKPCHSDTEDLQPMKYRSVKPKLKSSSEKKPRSVSPPCPHVWESHEDIERLEKSLRKKIISYDHHKLSNKPKAQAASTVPRCHSTPPVVASSYQSSSSIVTKKKEFVSVRKRAQILEDILITQQQQESSSASERATPIKPEMLAGAVRVLPPVLNNGRGHRSASVDMSFSANLSSQCSFSTLPRANKPFQSLGAANRDELASTPPMMTMPSKASTEAAAGKFQVAITSSEDVTVTQTETKKLTKHLWEEATKPKSNDSPPTIQMTAFATTESEKPPPQKQKLFSPKKFVLPDGPDWKERMTVWKPPSSLA